MFLASNPEYVAALTDLVLETMFSAVGQLLGRIGSYVHMVSLMGEDYAGQQGPLMSPAIYPEIDVPRQRKVVEFGRRCTDAPLTMHQDGAILSSRAGCSVRPIWRYPRGIPCRVIR